MSPASILHSDSLTWKCFQVCFSQSPGRRQGLSACKCSDPSHPGTHLPFRTKKTISEKTNPSGGETPGSVRCTKIWRRGKRREAWRPSSVRTPSRGCEQRKDLLVWFEANRHDKKINKRVHQQELEEAGSRTLLGSVFV